MKKLLTIFSALLVLAGCQEEFALDTDFSLPGEISSPAAVTLDVTSAENVVLSWTGGGAADGGILLYEVLFDRPGGNFSNPVHRAKSDRGSQQRLTLSHAALNIIARNAGIAPNSTGDLIWTVVASRGGESRMSDKSATISITRGEGIDNMPERLYVQGSAALEAGQEFRLESDGVYVIYTRIGAGALHFSSERDGSGVHYYADGNAKLVEGTGDYEVATAPTTGLVRVTVDFNSLRLNAEEIDRNVRCIWAANYADIAVLEYEGDGNFVGDGDVIFLGPGREGTPDWCTWVEERYYFIAKVDGVEKCWGSSLGGNAYTPDGTEEFFYVYESGWDQWQNLWKMDHNLDESHVTFTIETNKDNHMTHSCKGGAITYEQPGTAPTELYLEGAAAEAQHQAFRKVSAGVFEIYNKMASGSLSFVDGAGTKYFADSEGKLFIGKKNTTMAASEGVTKLTVDFGAKVVKTAQVSPEVSLVWAATMSEVVKLTYQGLGKYAGEGDILFLGPGVEGTPSWCTWQEERYYFYLAVDGEERKWGRLPEADGENRPDGEVPASFYHLGEYSRDDQWGNAWKMASALDGSHATVAINTNDDGAISHSFTISSSEPAAPTIIPGTLSLNGSGAETEGMPFRKSGDGVFQVVAKLKDGNISFKSGSKNYFLDASKGLLEGAGETASTATEGLATRITVNFKELSVKFEKLENLRAAWGANGASIMDFSYAGGGKFSAEGNVAFFKKGDFPWLTWEPEERYYFLLDVDGVTKCWGRLDSVTGEKPDGSADYYDFLEYAFSQWDHLWKFADEMDGAKVAIDIDTDKDGVMTHTVNKK